MKHVRGVVTLINGLTIAQGVEKNLNNHETKEYRERNMKKLIWFLPTLIVLCLARVTKLHIFKIYANTWMMDKMDIWDMQKIIMNL